MLCIICSRIQLALTCGVWGTQVSDREYQAGKPTTAERLKTAEQLVKKGQGADILFRDDDPVGTPVSASRFVSLASKHGDDDMFSSDFTDEELKVRNRQHCQAYLPPYMLHGMHHGCPYC